MMLDICGERPKNKRMSMRKYIFIAGYLTIAISILRPAFAAEPKQNTIHSDAISSPISNTPAPKNFHMPPAALEREMHDLERAQHLLEMSSQNDRSSHEAVAARHINAAVNELKLEAKMNAQEKRKGEPNKADVGATPVAQR
jgi:hypothetical protein